MFYIQVVYRKYLKIGHVDYRGGSYATQVNCWGWSGWITHVLLLMYYMMRWYMEGFHIHRRSNCLSWIQNFIPCKGTPPSIQYLWRDRSLIQLVAHCTFSSVDDSYSSFSSVELSALNEHECVESGRASLGTGATCSYFCGFFECFKSFTTEQDTTLLVGLNCGEAREDHWVVATEFWVGSVEAT